MDAIDKTLIIRALEIHGLLSAAPRRGTRRWHGALARAAAHLVSQEAQGDDLRIPYTLALLEQFGGERPSEDLATMVEIMITIDHPPATPLSARQ